MAADGRPAGMALAANSQERVDGPTPNGGAYAIAYFVDDQVRPVPKEQAVAAEIVEYTDDDEPLFRTYMQLGGTGAAPEAAPAPAAAAAA